ncbi:uncharacterized protein LOC131705044 [Acipenser ruthenus]|uniref:uncharacterized protein LOC131705044 n=1 Tax=Acipenser ruthenus TaxID=7906 RepID=UPI0027419BE3|nr:uncharacterized protein LOC131705044 [Acipenser ruthenus]
MPDVEFTYLQNKITLAKGQSWVLSCSLSTPAPWAPSSHPMVSHTISMLMMLRFSSPSPPLTPPSPPVSLPVCLLFPPGCTRITSNSTSLNLTSFSFPPPPPPLISLSVPLESTTLSPSSSAKNLGVTLDPCLSYSQHISTLARTCRFFLSNIRRIRPFLTNYATHLLVQALVLSRLDYCNSLLAGLPASATRLLQLIQNSAARLVFSLPRFAHDTPLLRSLHWLPITARIQFKTLVLAYRCLDQTAPSYLQTLISPYTPTRPLRSACTRRLALPPLRSPASRARSFSTLAPQWWNDLPTDVRTAQSLTTFRRLLKTHLFKQHL